MIYRNQISQVNHLSLNCILNKYRVQNYKAHLSKIQQIENRIVKPKKQAKIIEQKINELTKLKQFARNFRAKEQQLERAKKDIKMIKNINQRSQTSIFGQEKLRSTSSTVKFKSRVVGSSKSTKKLKNTQLPPQVKHQNQRLLKLISQKSFDQQKFRSTLRSTTKDYLKVRQHMRKIKAERASMKKFKTESSNNNDDNDASTKNIIQQMNEEEIKQIFTRINKKSEIMKPSAILTGKIQLKVNQNLGLIRAKTKNQKNLFTGGQILTQIIHKKL